MQEVNEGKLFLTGILVNEVMIKLILMSKLIIHIQVFFGKIAAWILPSFQVVPPLDPSLITRNPEEVSHLNILLKKFRFLTSYSTVVRAGMEGSTGIGRRESVQG